MKVSVARKAIVYRNRHQSLAESGPSSNVAQSEVDKRNKAEDDQEELQNLVINRAGEPSQKDIPQHDGCRNQYAECKIPAEKEVEKFSHRVHRDARRKDCHPGKRYRIQAAGLLIE